MKPADIVDFWLEAGPRRWFAKDDGFDAEIRARFEPLHHRAARRDLDRWAADADGALALLLLLDQFPRNLYRSSPHAFAADPLARCVADAALAAGHDRLVRASLRPFFYLPFTHSETLADQDRAVALFEAAATETGDRDSLKWAVMHRDVIARFGRFPHRNPALARETTGEERAFIDGGGFAG